MLDTEGLVSKRDIALLLIIGIVTVSFLVTLFLPAFAPCIF